MCEKYDFFFFFAQIYLSDLNAIYMKLMNVCDHINEEEKKIVRRRKKEWKTNVRNVMHYCE